MKPKKKIDKPKNKWKIAAIISMAINLLVAVLLAVGLAQPKTEKTNALSGGHYNIYEQSYNINPTNYDLSYFEDLVGIRIQYFSSDNFYAVYFENGSTIAESYLPIQNNFARAIYCYLYPNEVDNKYYLTSMYIYPYGTFEYYLVLSVEWDDVYLHEYVINYSPLSTSSPYIFIDNSNTSFNAFFESIFDFLGTDEVLSDYLITDNFNPNKYISIASDSIGALYDPPSAYQNATSGVKWSNPIYRGNINGAFYSTLGFLEIPLLFTSGGENFVGIRYYYDVVQSYIDKNNEWQTINYGNDLSTHEFHYTFVYMSYVYELADAIGTAKTTWKEKVVCAVPVYRIYHAYVDQNVEYRDYGYYLFQPYKWLSDSYKTISVYEASTEQLGRVGIDEDLSRSRFAINGLTIEEILKYDMTQEKDGVGTGNYIGNVFIVIKDAFASLMPLLSLTIIPGITIGMLMFLPLVLTIIIVVIKLVKR